MKLEWCFSIGFIVLGLLMVCGGIPIEVWGKINWIKVLRVSLIVLGVFTIFFGGSGVGLLLDDEKNKD